MGFVDMMAVVMLSMDGWREGSTDISRFAGLLVNVQCCNAGGVPTVVAKK